MNIIEPNEENLKSKVILSQIAKEYICICVCVYRYELLKI